VRLFFDLFKLRIGLVIGFTAVAGIAVTPGGSLPGWQVLVLALAVTMASAAAGAFNQYVERDVDVLMRRTRNRAFVTGTLHAGPAWLATIALIAAGGVLLAALAINVTSAVYPRSARSPTASSTRCG
jgi:protoheme IX farnesyltransferase